MLFDSHAHYNDAQFDPDRFELLDKMPENGIGYIVNAADSMESIGRILPLCERYSFLYAAIGVHPEEAGAMTDADIDRLRELSRHEKVCAIGEIGLDYHYDDVPREVQKKWFDKQLSLAEELDMPVVIHDREAHADCVEILSRHDIRKTGGVMHCYSGSCEMARELLDMGFFFGFGGTVTFKNAKKTQKAAEEIPIERILLETDCPYLAPEPYRGRRNSSLLMRFAAEKLAELKGMSVAEVEAITTENAKKMYRIG